MALAGPAQGGSRPGWHAAWHGVKGSAKGNELDETCRWPGQASTAAIADVIDGALRDPGTGWSTGVFGALAEFMHDPGEAVALEHAPGSISARTARGGLRVVCGNPQARLVAWEEPAQAPGQWRQAAALCLPAAQAAIGGAGCLTALGADAEALDPAHRGQLLFDIGAGFDHVRACIRTGDPGLVALLLAAEGQEVVLSGHPVVAAIISASPHRVFLSAVARVEVYQPIPGAHDRAPEGPHTHVNPALLRHRRPHAATRPLPEGWVSGLDFYPANPLHDIQGQPQPFDADCHDAFQSLLQRFGLPEALAEKQRVTQALHHGVPAADYALAATRPGRAAARVALRQLAQTHPALPGLADHAARVEPGAGG